MLLQQHKFNLVAKAAEIIRANHHKDIIGHLLFKSENKILKVYSTNLESALEIELDTDEVEEIDLSVRAESLIHIIKNINAELLICKTERLTMIKSGKKYRAELPGFSSEDFPKLEKAKETFKFEINRAEFIEKSKKVSISCLQVVNNKPYLEGVCLTEKNIVASDGFRLSIMDIDIKNAESFKSFILPYKAIAEIKKIFGNESAEMLQFEVSEKNCQISVAGIIYTTRLIDSKFPSFSQVIPDKNEYTLIMLNKSDIQQGLNLIGKISSDKVFVKISGDTFEIEGSEHENATINNYQFNIVNQSELNISIPFNLKYLSDFISEMQNISDIKMYIKNEKSQSLFEAGEYNYILMPMRI